METRNHDWSIGAPAALGGGVVLALVLLLVPCPAFAESGPKPPFDGRSSDNGQETAPSQRLRRTAASEKPLFVEVAKESGLDFRHVSGKLGELFYHEIMGGGCAFLDYDNDGDADVYLVQGHPIPKDFDYAAALPAPEKAGAYRDRLFRNDLGDASGDKRRLAFVDVTEKSGIAATGYGMGVAAGDVDNDGWIDLYVTNYGPDQLWRNDGGGADGIVTFSDVTKEAGVTGALFSVSASFLDFNRDGWLDLYVANYIDYRHLGRKQCRHPSGAPDYCAPSAYRHQPDQLYRNRGDGTFEDVSEALGIGRVRRSSLGVVAVDVNADGWLDVYVGNDMAENLLWINDRGRSFTDEALLRGAALSGSGRAEASMGVDGGDFDGDGDEDLLAAHMNKETNTLYLNLGDGFFDDRSAASGIGRPGWRHTTYAPAWLDYDNDGLLDLLTVNGGMVLFNNVASPDDPNPLADPNQLFRNLGGGRFAEVTAAAGPALELWESGRGVATGDVDNDGDADVLLTNNDGPVRLLRNQVGSESPWLGLRLVDPKAQRDLLGAYVEIVRAQAPPIVRRVATDGSYGSAKDPRVLVGLGAAPKVTAVRVRWPDGTLEEFRDLPLGAYTVVKQGSGREPQGPSLLRIEKNEPSPAP
ncbi:MAG: CRTAC1 family protein [bacterium]|nr:CRTAC1 family protein [bacterium]